MIDDSFDSLKSFLQFRKIEKDRSMNSRRFFEGKSKIHDSFDLLRRFAGGDRREDDPLIYRRFTEEFLDSIGKSKMHDSFDLSKKYKAIDDYFRVD